MPKFVPGQFRQALQDKIRAVPTSEEETPPQIRKSATDFSPRASDYHSRPQSTARPAPGGTASLPKDSPLNKPVHQRMKEFVKQQYKGGK